MTTDVVEQKPLRVLNLYAGIGGNRKLWTGNIQVTAVEYDPDIAAIYKDLHPNDNVVIGDAHQYLIDNYKDFDFIWTSPPCQSHSITNHFLHAQGVIRYPQMELYQEIIFLQIFCKGKYVVENVKSYYTPLIKPQISGRHYFWANFKIPLLKNESSIGRMGPVKSKGGDRTEGDNHHKLGFDLTKYKYSNKNKLLNNCVSPEIGKAVFDSAYNSYNHDKVNQIGLFKNI